MVLSRVLSVAVALAFVPPARAAAPTFALRFDGGTGWETKVACAGSRQRAEGTVSLQARYTLAMQPVGDGYALGYRDFAVERAEGAPPGFDLEGALMRLAEAGPRTLVAKDGTFAGIEDPEAALARAQAFLEEILPPDPKLRAAVLPMVKQTMTPELVRASSASEWNTLVGGWVGVELEAGRVYTGEDVLPFPLLPGETVPADLSFSARGPVACGAAGGDGCVEITLRTLPKPKAMERLTERFLKESMERMGKTAPKNAISRLGMESVVVLVTEPGTLRPHSVSKTKTMEVEARGEDGATTTQRRVDQNACTYTWGS